VQENVVTACRGDLDGTSSERLAPYLVQITKRRRIGWILRMGRRMVVEAESEQFDGFSKRLHTVHLRTGYRGHLTGSTRGDQTGDSRSRREHGGGNGAGTRANGPIESKLAHHDEPARMRYLLAGGEDS
jgi:hypothetical protein